MNRSTVTSNDRQQMDPITPGDAGQHDLMAPTLGGDKIGVTTSEALKQAGKERSYDRGVVAVGCLFKGFLAWSLCGLTPVVESSTTTMKSTLFGNMKAATSFGKRISHLKRGASSVNLDEEMPMHHHKKASTGKNTTRVVCYEPGNDTANSNKKQLTELLFKSLVSLERQAVEKERQKNNFLRVRICKMNSLRFCENRIFCHSDTARC
jgi:hypothetical protein